MGTALEPVPELMLGPRPGTEPEMVLGPGTEPVSVLGSGSGSGPGPGTELETVLELEAVAKVLEPLPELVPGQGTTPEMMPELEKEKETEQGNKYSVLHP